MTTAAIIQARMSSTRLPGKVLKPLGESTVLGWCVRAAQSVAGVDVVVVATSDDQGDDAVARWCEDHHVLCVRGSLHDVLARYVKAAQQVNATRVMRLTADCPLLDPQVCAQVLRLLDGGAYDYASNIEAPRTWPQGLDCEAFSAQALYRAAQDTQEVYDHEHVTPYIRTHPELFKATALSCPRAGIGLERWTVDYPHDYEFVVKLMAHWPENRPPRYTEILEILKSIPEPHNRNTAA